MPESHYFVHPQDSSSRTPSGSPSAAAVASAAMMLLCIFHCFHHVSGKGLCVLGFLTLAMTVAFRLSYKVSHSCGPLIGDATGQADNRVGECPKKNNKITTKLRCLDFLSTIKTCMSPGPCLRHDPPRAPKPGVVRLASSRIVASCCDFPINLRQQLFLSRKICCHLLSFVTWVYANGQSPTQGQGTTYAVTEMI